MIRAAVLLCFLVLTERMFAFEMPFRIGGVTLSVPADFEHVVEQGIDSSVGHFITPDGLKIGYDLGRFGGCPSRLAEMTEEELRRVMFYEDGPANAPGGFILVKKLDAAPMRPTVYYIILGLGKGVGSLGVEVTDGANLAKAQAAIRAISISK